MAQVHGLVPKLDPASLPPLQKGPSLLQVALLQLLEARRVRAAQSTLAKESRLARRHDL